MNCQDFDELVASLVNHHLMEATARERGLAHAALCTRCAARLADERVLGNGLTALAESTQAQHPSPQLRATLRAAFEAQHQTTVPRITPAVATAKVLPFATRPARNTSRWMLAAAAAVLILLAIMAPLWWRTASPNNLNAGGGKQPQPSPETTPEKPLPQIVTPTRDDRREIVENKITRTPKRRLRQRSFASAIARRETTTEFIPLTYVSDATSVQSGMIVRVEVERATLIAMGLPLNVERAGSRVTADLMLGDDGVARAIRLVN